MKKFLHNLHKPIYFFIKVQYNINIEKPFSQRHENCRVFVFLGENTPEPIGDYFGGTNHVLPTSGTARFFSALSVDSFIKKSSFLYYSEEAVKEDGEKIINIANKEGLTAHANSIKVRLK